MVRGFGRLLASSLFWQMLRVKAGVREKTEVLTMGFARRALVVRAAWLAIVGTWMELGSGPVDRCVFGTACQC